jgi:mono/diheme cytochrome c family protein
MKRSVRQRSEHIAVPSLGARHQVVRGHALYREHCEQCHGGPGVAPKPFALGMTPTPANLAHTAREWPAADLFWVVKEGIKMTGMPAWSFRLHDDDLWALVAFMRELPRLSPADYRGGKPEAAAPGPPAPRPADPDRGRKAIHQYACLTCHEIPGMVGANAPVGPPLAGMASRAVIAGRLPNDAGHLADWLMDPQRFNPGSAMPSLGVSEQHARDMAAFLATLR